jgi:stearoyl-CoA desaturase (Delta-9 desaturase)
LSDKRRINWVNTLFLIAMPIIGIVGTVLFCVFSLVSWPTWILAAVMLTAGGLSITAGYHRLFSHRTYKAAWPIRLFFVLFGSATFEGSVLEWSTDHRNHHRYTDTDKDPYSVKKGFFHAHMGWLFTINNDDRDYSNVEDLKKDRLLRFQYRYYRAFAIGMGFLFPTAIAALWGDPLGGLIVAGALRITLGHHGTFCINSLCHTIGKRRYSDQISARDNWLSALVTFGEGYHNYHHQFALDYRNGVRFYQYDPSKWLIWGLSRVGLASNLHRVPKYRVIQARIETHQRLMAAKPQAQPVVLEQLQDAIMQLINKIREFEKQYAESKLKSYRVKLKQARGDLKSLFSAWKRARTLQALPV